ncbi:MAG: response regulator [Alphaproteobacteria bacterium]
MARILIVEDEYLIAAAAEAALDAAGHRAVVASDGRAALEWLRDNLPDLIVTDYMMPRMDGGKLVAAVRADPRLAHVPIVMVTATPPETIRSKGLDIQMLLSKPVMEAALLRAVETLVGPR